MRRYAKTIHLPTYYSRQPVTKAIHRKRTQYVYTKAKGNGSAILLAPYSHAVDPSHADAMADHHNHLPWTHALHLQFDDHWDPMSARKTLELFLQDLGRWRGKNISSAGFPAGQLPMYAVIEFGDKLGDIHAHMLISTACVTSELERIWRRHGGAVIHELDKVTDRFSAIRYCISRELQYSEIDATHFTTFSNDLVICRYSKRRFLSKRTPHPNKRSTHATKHVTDHR